MEGNETELRVRGRMLGIVIYLDRRANPNRLHLLWLNPTLQVLK